MDTIFNGTLFPTKPTLTYVSCFVNINCKEPHKTHQWRMDNFLHIAKTGAPIVLYVDKEIKEAYKDVWPKYSNIIIRDVDYSSSWTYKVCSLYKDNLPASRNHVKDSFLFLCLMNMKIEFVVSAVNENPFNTSHFAWVDFNLAHIFKEKSQTADWMHYLTTCNWAPKFIANPGCWDKGQGQESIVDNINWRFCGGFMIGDGESFNELFDLYLVHFTPFMHKYRHITWEVNFWAWLEVNAQWNITWYKADHDDSIVKVPSRLLAFRLPATKYIPLTPQLPSKSGFFPMSASYAEHNNKHILNVRYINYQLDPQGRYIIHHPQGHLETQNLRCYLSDDLEKVESSEFMWEGMMQLKEYDTSIKGLEDIRLYKDNTDGCLKYVATNRSYNPAQKIRIMTGDYNDTMAMFENGTILEPPTDTQCEKNWIFTETGAVIYKWSPFELGKVIDGQLKIVKSLPSRLPRIRGSTVPVKIDDGYMCVVHYCEHGQQGLEYYHILVKLNDQMEPVQWSNPFYFNKIGIQYCIGFTIRENDVSLTSRDTSYPLAEAPSREPSVPLAEAPSREPSVPLKNKNMYFWFSEHDSSPGLVVIGL